jgi:hypothetical protein
MFQRQVFTCKVWWYLPKVRKKGEQSIGLADTIIYNRTKDAAKVTADWFSELLLTDPWFKGVVPDVRDLIRWREQING